jgi:hypothetical protein
MCRSGSRLSHLNDIVFRSLWEFRPGPRSIAPVSRTALYAHAAFVTAMLLAFAGQPGHANALKSSASLEGQQMQARCIDGVDSSAGARLHAACDRIQAPLQSMSASRAHAHFAQALPGHVSANRLRRGGRARRRGARFHGGNAAPEEEEVAVCPPCAAASTRATLLLSVAVHMQLHLFAQLDVRWAATQTSCSACLAGQTAGGRASPIRACTSQATRTSSAANEYKRSE